MNDFKILLQAVLDANSINQSDINKIQKVIEKYHLNITADLDKASIIAEIKKIVPELEAELKKLTGVDIHISDNALEKAFKQVEKDIAKATKEEEKFIEAMARGREQAERLRQTEEKRQQLAQNNAYNKALDEEYVKRQKLVEQVNKIQHLSDTGTFTKQVSDATVEYNKLSTVTDDLKTDFAELQRLQTVLGTSQTDEELISNYEKFNTILEKVKNNMHVLVNEQKQAGTYNTGALVEQKKIDSLAESVLKFRDNNTKMSKDLRRQFTGVYDSLINGTNLTEKEVRKLSQEFTNLKLRVREAGQLGQSFGDKMKNAIAKFAEWGFSSNLVMETVQSVKKMITKVHELDTSMTSLYKVTDETDATYNKFLNIAIKSAKELGATITDIVNSTADFAKLGYSLDDARALAKVATIYKNVGDIDIESATESIVSTMAAFGYTAEEAMSIVDKFNQIGNNFSISSADIGEALQRSAASLATSGNTLDESIALITAGNTIVQDADTVGTALKTVSLRLTSTTAELEAMGEETEFACETLSDYRDLVMGLTNNKVDILGDNGEYKNTYTILQDISKVWSKMDSMSQSSLLKSLFGTRQANIGASLIAQFATAEKVLASSLDSAGSAIAENEKYLESIGGKVQQFEASFQSLSNTIIDSNLIKGVVDFGTTTISWLDKVIDKFGTLPTLMVTVSGILGGKNLGILYKRTKSNHHNCFEYALYA